MLALPELVTASAVLVCLSFGDEIDTWGLVDRLLARRVAVYVPRVDGRTGTLHVHRYPCPLETLPFGLEQPLAGADELAAKAIDSTLDAALLVGVGFDRRGYRLGSGRGYFDRFLSRHPLETLGLAYDCQLVDELPTEPHDVPLDVVVTESTTLRR